MESRGRGMEIDTDSGLARSALATWRRRTLHPDHIHTGDKKGGDTYSVGLLVHTQKGEYEHILGFLMKVHNYQ